MSPSLTLRRLAHEDAADVVLLEVQGEAEDAVRELEQLARHDLLEAVDAGDAVADGDDGPDLGHLEASRSSPASCALMISVISCAVMSAIVGFLL